jgi:glycosyltransferase involved in cell wall biosynthesis
LTLRQWDRGADPGVEGVDVRVVGPRMRLYSSPGRRRVLPPLVFGAGVLWYLLRHGRRFDVVHTASFPYFSLLAAAMIRPLAGFRLVVDWHEVWSRDYWREYLGTALGAIGWAVQLACVRLRQRAFCFSRLHAARLVEHGLRGDVSVLTGEYEAGEYEASEYEGPTLVDNRRQPAPLVVFAGRHIPEKRAPAVVPAIAMAAERIPALRGVVFGDGPDRPRVLGAIAANGAQDIVDAPGFVAAETVEHALHSALCMVLPSRREGYGLIVVEAAARGVPSVVVREADNAAIELIEDGVNGTIARSASPADLAEAIIRVHRAGSQLRQSTAVWYRRNATRLSLGSSLDEVVASYAGRRATASSEALLRAA